MMSTQGGLLFLVLTFVALVSFRPSAAMQPQQHAPSLETCQADVALWYDHAAASEYLNAETAHISENSPNRTPAARLPLREIVARELEMGDCMKVDAIRRERYLQAIDFYDRVSADRYRRFVRRHKLEQQLLREDAAGLR